MVPVFHQPQIPLPSRPATPTLHAAEGDVVWKLFFLLRLDPTFTRFVPANLLRKDMYPVDSPETGCGALAA